mgnify:CR=1 FL=1
MLTWSSQQVGSPYFCNILAAIGFLVLQKIWFSQKQKINSFTNKSVLSCCEPVMADETVGVMITEHICALFYCSLLFLPSVVSSGWVVCFVQPTEACYKHAVIGEISPKGWLLFPLGYSAISNQLSASDGVLMSRIFDANSYFYLLWLLFAVDKHSISSCYCYTRVNCHVPRGGSSKWACTQGWIQQMA